MSGVLITTPIYKAVITNDYDLVSQLLETKSMDELFHIYVRLKYSNLDLYLDFIKNTARERLMRLEVRKVVVEQLPVPLDVALYISRLI